MITLRDDQLTFSFPEIDQELRALMEAYIKATLPRILAENRKDALLEIRSGPLFRRALPKGLSEAERVIRDATPEEIEKAFLQKVFSVVKLTDDEFARVNISFQRTLRIPDDGKTYPLPAGLGRFPLRHVDDFIEAVPGSWADRGGVLMPLYQSEALWIHFSSRYPFAVRVAAGKINAVTGEMWAPGLQASPQNYLVVPEQPWLDGFAVEKGVIRQFVAMPLGDGYSVEEQVTGKADTGGIQLQVYPLNAKAYWNYIAEELPSSLQDVLLSLVRRFLTPRYQGVEMLRMGKLASFVNEAEMGLGAGGKMRQEIYEDPHSFEEWDGTRTGRCFVHLCNSQVWRQITGSNPPHRPFTSKEYATARIPWFDHYRDDLAALPGSSKLNGVKSVATVAKEKGAKSLPGNSTMTPELIIQYGNTRRPDEVREWVE